MPSVEEVSDPLVVVIVGLRLCQLVVMVGELEIYTTRVNIHGRAEDGTRHNAALNMPAGTAYTIDKIEVN